MGAGTLEARLTVSLLVLGAGVLAAVGIGAFVMTDHALDASDTAAALGQAAAGRDALRRELDEGDQLQAAIEEVTSAARAQGARLEVRSGGQRLRLRLRLPEEGAPDLALPDLAPGTCATALDQRGRPWRACAAGAPEQTVVAAVPIETHRAALTALSRSMVAVLVVALAAFWLAVRRALRSPIGELASLVRWTEQIVENEKALAPPPARTREIQRLETAFDALVRRLLEALARERANSAHIAHELRTPLTAVMAELGAVDVADDASRDAIARIRGDLTRLADVIEAILVLSDDNRRVSRDGEIVNIADLARSLAPLGARVEAPDEALVEGDERLMSLAARNLLDNARKYGSGVRILRVSREGEDVRLAVVDGGPGLDAAARQRMFDRYWRGVADGEGRGLGLALVRAVAERHGGRAEAIAAPDGLGLEVAMTLGRAVAWNE
jgi:signal transduction histidine kinase